MNKKIKLILFLILLLGFSLRIFNINWDEGYVFHPDERAIIMAVDQLEYPKNISTFLSIQSPLNPNFFAYGNFPLYILKIASDALSLIDPTLAQYGGMHLVGRLINAGISTLTIFLIFIFSKRLFNTRVGILASFFYAIAVFPIQNAHFYTVDTLLTFLTLLALLFLDFYIEKPTIKNSSLLGGIFGLSLATKISILPLGLIIGFGFLLAYFKKSKKSPDLIEKIIHVCVFTTTTIIVFFTTQPYVLLDFKSFYEQISLQSKMGSDPFIFPYTLQYVGKVPILYEITNILFWGIGIPLSIFAFAGILHLTFNTIKNYRSHYRHLPFIFFFWIYFLLVSSYAVGWMRYLLPIYPILIIAGALFCAMILFPYFTDKLRLNQHHHLKLCLLYIFLVSASAWTFSFLNIYTKVNTRIAASSWINEHIPQNSVLAIEHWDDQLPIYGGENYILTTLPLYDPDTQDKWDSINSQLENANYIVIASNRLREPLQRLTDCASLPPTKCYPKTSKYYQDLFTGRLEFKKIAEFASYPKIPILNIAIDDQSADESFTVYDHPYVVIFKKE